MVTVIPVPDNEEPLGANQAEDATMVIEGMTNSSDTSDKDRVARCSDGPGNRGASSILRQASKDSMPAIISISGRDMASLLHNREMKSVIVNDGDGGTGTQSNHFQVDNGIPQEMMRIHRCAWQTLFIMCAGVINRDLAKMPAITAIAPRLDPALPNDPLIDKKMPYENFGTAVSWADMAPYTPLLGGHDPSSFRVYDGGCFKMASDDLFTFACEVAQAGHLFSDARIDDTAGAIILNTNNASDYDLPQPVLNYDDQMTSNSDHDQPFVQRTTKPFHKYTLKLPSESLSGIGTAKIIYTGFPDRIDVVADPFFRPWIRYLRYDDTRFFSRSRSVLSEDPSPQPNGRPGPIPHVIHERHEASRLDSQTENNRIVNELTLKHNFADDDDTIFGSSNVLDIDIFSVDHTSQALFGQHSATIQAPQLVTTDEPAAPNYYTAAKMYHVLLNMYAGLWHGGIYDSVTPEGSIDPRVAGIKATNARLRNGAVCSGGSLATSMNGFTARVGDLMEVRQSDFYNSRTHGIVGGGTSNTISAVPFSPAGAATSFNAMGVKPGHVLVVGAGPNRVSATILAVQPNVLTTVKQSFSYSSGAPFVTYDPATVYNDILLGLTYGMESEQLGLELGLPKMNFKDITDRRSTKLANTVGR